MKNIFSRISNFPKDYLLEVERTYLKCESVINIAKWYKNLDKLAISVANKKVHTNMLKIYYSNSK